MTARAKKLVPPCPLCAGEYYRGRAEALEEVLRNQIVTAQLRKLMVCKNCRYWRKQQCSKTGTVVCGSDRCTKWELKGK